MCIKIIYVRLCKTPSCVCAVCIYHHISIWGVPEVGVPPNHPFIDGFSLLINHPAMGVPSFMEPPIDVHCVSRLPRSPNVATRGGMPCPLESLGTLWLWPIAASEHGPNFFIFLTMVPKILLKAILIHFFGKSTLIGISFQFTSYKPTAWRWNSKWSNWPAARWVLRIGTGCKRLGTGALPWDMMDMAHQTWLLRKKKGKVH